LTKRLEKVKLKVIVRCDACDHAKFGSVAGWACARDKVRPSLMAGFDFSLKFGRINQFGGPRQLRQPKHVGL